MTKRSRATYRLYVIELSDDVGPRTDPDLPWVYVGETTLSAEARFRQHVDGARNTRGPLYSRWPRRFGVRLRPDLHDAERTWPTREEAKRAESELAESLRQRGYSVKGGH